MRSRGWAAIAATVAFGASGLGLVGPAGAGIGGDAEATLSPNPAEPGETVTATSVDPCPPILVVNSAEADAAPAGPLPVSTVFWFLTTPDPDSEADVVDEGDVEADPDGSWEVEFSAPDDEGAYEFYASCSTEAQAVALAAALGGGGSDSGEYGPVDLVVAAGDDFSASLDKSSGLPGDDIELTAIQCDGDSGAAALLPVGDPPPTPFTVDEDVLQQYDVIDGQFGGVVPVPDDTAPGTYQVVVWCVVQTRVVDSQVLGYTVLAAADPVPAAPDFTG